MLSVPGLHETVREASLPWQTLEPGEVLVVAPGALVLLAQGELEVHGQAGLLEFREAPACLVRTGRLRARAGCRVAEVQPEHLAELLGPEHTLQLLCEEARRLERWRDGQLRRDDDFFADDTGGLVPGPYRFGPYDAMSVLVRGPVAHVLPRGLRPIPGLANLSLLVLSKVEGCRALHAMGDHRDHGYREVAGFVPCWGPRGPGFYLPEVYPDAYLPILFGREVYGFAKRMGRILEHPDGFDLIASGTHRLRVRTEQRVLASPRLIHAMRTMRWLLRVARPRLYLRKQILDVRSGRRARHRIDEWVMLPFTVFHLEASATMRSVSVEYPDGRWTLPGEPLGALSLTLGFTFGDGKVVRRAWWRRRM